MEIFTSCLTVLIVLAIAIALVVAVGAIMLTYLPYILAAIVALWLFKKLTTTE